MSPERALEGWLQLQEAYPERFLIMIIMMEGVLMRAGTMMKLEEVVEADFLAITHMLIM